jgi:hypothetical protein
VTQVLGYLGWQAHFQKFKIKALPFLLPFFGLASPAIEVLISRCNMQFGGIERYGK